MSTVNTNSAIDPNLPTTNGTVKVKGYNDLKPEDFMKLLIAQLKSQDPTKPMDNQEILNQIGSINNVNVQQQMISTLTNLNTSQGLSSASSLIGKEVTADAGDGKNSIIGLVDSATVKDGKVYVNIGDQSVSIDKITGIRGDTAQAS